MTGIPRETAPGFAELGVVAFTTTRRAGTFGTNGPEPVSEVLPRWDELREFLGAHRLATSHQVHGAQIEEHGGGWRGWLRCGAADGHLSAAAGTAMAVTVADCVPVFIAHRSGASALLHSGWKGTAAGITAMAIALLAARGTPASELALHCGPSICGRCYEVSPDVYAALTGRGVDRPTPVDLRALIASHARAAGVREVTISASCTRCDNDRFYSHRAGDLGRQVGVLFAPPLA
jgi:polyphenol oxidase